jgi:hypothetical protein
MNKNYVVAKTSNNGEITFVNYNKLDGFKVIPKNKIEYPGIEVNEMLIVKTSFIEKMLKRKNKIKLNYYLNYIIEQSEDDGNGDLREALDNIERYKEIIEYKYRKYLDDRYINLLNKKVDLLERKIKTKLIYKEMNFEPKKSEKKGKSR